MSNRSWSQDDRLRELDVRWRVEQATEIFQQYGEHIRAIVAFVVRDEDMAEDLYQDFYLALVQCPLPDGIRDMESYLFVVLLNRAKGHFQRDRKYRECIHQYAQHRMEHTLQPDVVDMMMRADDVDKVWGVARKVLEPRELEAIHLRYGEGQANREVGKRLGLKANTIARYLWSAIEKIRCFPTLQERG